MVLSRLHVLHRMPEASCLFVEKVLLSVASAKKMYKKYLPEAFERSDFIVGKLVLIEFLKGLHTQLLIDFVLCNPPFSSAEYHLPDSYSPCEMFKRCKKRP